MLRKSLIIAAAVLAVVACSKEAASGGDAPSGSGYISFKSYTQGQTRSDDVTGDNLEKINVLAKYCEPQVLSTWYKYFNTEFTKSNGRFDTGYPWPVFGYMDFWASNMPIDDADTSIALTDALKDVVVAPKTRVESASESVQLQFKHIFSKVTLRAKTDTSIRKATIRSVYIFLNDNPTKYSFAGDSVSLSGIQWKKSFREGSANIIHGDFQDVALSGEYIAPQSAKVIIGYDVYGTETGSSVLLKSATDTLGPYNFEAGKNVILQLTFNVDDNTINFTSDVPQFSDSAPEP
ncbi:MAG: fimbrillin family protein [Bacteroidales bacterium]|nr:fimbrillin family protein [Bacteroidales bacterium]